MMNGQMNVMRREAGRVLARQATTRVGTVSAYDPAHYAAKVVVQPDGFETGWLPVTTPWSGNGWGLFAPPSPGDTVDVHFQEGGKEAGFIALRFYSNKTRPLPAPSGEFWLVHASGAFLKLTNDGKALLNSAVEIDATAPVIQVTATDAIHITAPHVYLGGQGETLHQIVTDALVALFNSHTHGNVEVGSGDTGVPNQPMGQPHLTTVLRAD